MKLVGLSRQIALSMAAMALGVTLLVLLGSYAFYYVAMTYWPKLFTEPSFIPTAPEVAWMVATTVAALAMAVVLGIKLSRRILMPLNSVADGLRRVAQGELDARAVASDRSLGEAATLADDFNGLVDQLQRVTQQQIFWNAAIAHELRTPVTILRGRLQGLADGVFTPDEAQFRRLLTQVEALSHLIEDLRVVSLADSGHLHLQMQEADLAAEIRAVVDSFEDAMHSSGQRSVLELDERRVCCDPVRIRQALLALLENARRHAVPGKIRIQTRIEQGRCHLRVADEGPGIAAEFVDHVFKEFWRADESRSREGGGSGLGLAVVSAIARAHGGQATCRSAPGSGTVFELSWPVR